MLLAHGGIVTAVVATIRSTCCQLVRLFFVRIATVSNAPRLAARATEQIMQMFVAGKWQNRAEQVKVTNPFDGTVIDTVPRGSTADVDAALTTLVEGARVMRAMPAAERCRVLQAAAKLLRHRAEEFARTITLEEGKILAESRLEVSRACETLEVSAEEAKRINGEVFPMDAAPGGAGKFGFTLRVPCGIVAAITQFNFPPNLVAHNVGPALAAGNAVLIKPAGDTPLTAQAAMRPSNIDLAMNVYTDPKLLDVQGTLDLLPSLDLNPSPSTERAAMRATGTNDQDTKPSLRPPVSLVAPPVAPNSGKRGQTASIAVI